MKRLVDLKGAFHRAGSKADGDLIVPMAFSSEEPVARWWGNEILDHSKESIRLDRLNDGAPVLFNHNPNELRGTHESGTVRVMKDRVLRGDIRLTSATQAGRDTIALVESNVLTKASIGYRIHKVTEETKKRDGTIVKRELPGAAFERIIEELDSKRDRRAFQRSLDAQFGSLERDADGDDDEMPTYRATDWEPFENSLVTVPADNTVGLGRAGNEQQNGGASASSSSASNANNHRSNTMSGKTPQELAAEAQAAEDARKRAEREAMEKAERDATEELRRRAADPVAMETSRHNAIKNVAKANKIADNIRDAWIQQGYNLEQVSNDLVRILEERGKNNPGAAVGALGLSPQETQRFSFVRAIKAVADGNWNDAGFEAECTRALAQKLGRVVDPKAFLVPFEVLRRPIDNAARAALEGMGKRDLTVATVGAGGYLVGTENVGFIEMLRNRSVAFKMGVRQLAGLQGNVTIPRQSAAATAFWLSNEATAITESQQTFVQVALSPKTAGAYTEISRQLLLQSSPGAEGIVTDDLAQVIALAADLAVLEGSGAAGQPLGISGTSGIGAIGALTTIAFSHLLSFQTSVAGSNVTPSRGGYVTTPTVAALLMQRVKYASTASPLWDGNVWDGNVCGFPGMASLQPTAGSMVFGDWQECVVGEWGVLEVSVNPYANFAAGIIGVRAMYSLDVGVRRPFAFARGTGAT
jgi:HK97 family phage major capsid protein